MEEASIDKFVRTREKREKGGITRNGGSILKRAGKRTVSRKHKKPQGTFKDIK